MVNKQLPNLTPEQRQANIDRMISAWKERKKKIEQEAQERYKTPEFQEVLAELRSRNASPKA
ncbi:MAG: hypothetical protein EAZ91_00790 [Cytophagales bacterium]|nr:MAG: hypothetical protein EAZ91_00790 [Cytophagales bacterium]